VNNTLIVIGNAAQFEQLQTLLEARDLRTLLPFESINAACKDPLHFAPDTCALLWLDGLMDRQSIQRLVESMPVLAVVAKSAISREETALLEAGVHEVLSDAGLNQEILAKAIDRCTRRFQSNRSLSGYRSMFNALCDSLPFQMAYRIRAKKGEVSKFVYVSKGVEYISGLSREAVLENPQTLYDQIYHEDRGRLQAAEAKAVASLIPHEIEIRKIDATGTLKWVHIRSAPTAYPDGTIIWDGVETDITDYKRSEEEVRTLLRINQDLLERERAAREEVEAHSKMKDQFLATLSHELRTPINSVMGWTQLIKRKLLSESEIAKGIDTIERNAQIQSRMIADLLDMNRIISGKIVLEWESVDIYSLLLDTVDTFRPSAQEKSIDLGLACHVETPVVVRGEPARLRQIFSNIITNAMKFTPQDGKVSVQILRSGGDVKIIIRDTGIGIDSETLPFIFDRFRQADASYARKFGGLGLGLAIVKQLVDLHHGDVHATSDGAGQGTCFELRFPMALDSASYARPCSNSIVVTHAPPQLSPGIRVLLVDDELEGLEFTRRILIEAGANVLTAHDGSSALQILDNPSSSIDIIVSDIGMPGMDGIEMLRQIRSDSSPAKNVPAIALTAFALKEDANRILAGGYELHLTKPVTPFDLIRAINMHTERDPSKKSAIG
jgi:PAS domain S-box-containing protein